MPGSAVGRRLGPVAKAGLAAEILAVYVRVRFELRRGREIEAVVADLRAAGPGRLTPAADPRQIAGAVEGMLEVLPTDTRCLTRSLVLLAMLEKRGLACRLLIGVRTEPSFLAHAWVVRDGHSLIDDGAGEFSPITTL